MSKIRISAVNYLNSKPFIYGLKNSSLKNQIDLQLDVPSICADKLMSGQVDIGLVPVAILPELPEYHIISDYCIAAEGAVGSVLLLSNCPLQQVEEVLLDYQSRTSIVLAEVLLKKSFRLNPTFMDGIHDFQAMLQSGKRAAVVIGDRALRFRNNYEYVYDLAQEWQKFTLLPFVFAQWVSTTNPEDNFLEEFNDALKLGLNNRSAIAAMEQNTFPGVDVKDYLLNKINYSMDARKQMGLDLFLTYVEESLSKNVLKIV